MSEPRARRPRRQRSVTESLLSIVLVLEAVLIFFVTLVVYGLHALPPALAFGGGAGLAVVLLIAALLVRWRAGVWFGWLLQAVIIATGVLVTLMYVVGAAFAVIWVYCVVRARAIERAKAEFAAAQASEVTQPTQGDNA